MKAIVTGGAGFLGSYVCERLLADGAEVFCIDNLSSGNVENIKCIQNKKFNFVKKDIIDFSENGMPKSDYIFHLASLASPDFYQKHPIKTIDVNTVATKNILEQARKSDSAVLFSSTSEVYGDAAAIPTPETYWGNVNPVGVRSCYDEGKRCGEAYCKAYERMYGIDVRIVRIFNTYGPRLRAKEGSSYGRVVPRFIEQALSGKSLTVFGNGLQTRSFSFISDTIDGIMRVAFDKKAKGEIFNIGNENELTIKELADKIIMLTGSKSKIIYKPLPQDDPKRRNPDISKARKTLGWEPKVSFDEGLKRTIEWHKNNM